MPMVGKRGVSPHGRKGFGVRAGVVAVRLASGGLRGEVRF